MGKLFDTVHEIEANRELIRNRAYGVIEVQQEQFTSLQFRPWPKIASIAEAVWANGWGKKRDQKNRFLLYFSQPLFHRDFLTINYVVSSLQTSMTTCMLGLSVLDRIAEIKQSNAIICELSNRRISDRFMQRAGWEIHNIPSRRRHWIKRFYGEYPKTFLHQQLQESVKQ